MPSSRSIMPTRRRQMAGRRSRSSRLAIPMAPPQIKSNIIVHHKYRFVATTGLSFPLTSKALCIAAGSMCTVANSTVTSLFASVRLDKIEMWSPPPSQGSYVTISAEFTGQAQSANVEFSDTTVSTSQPAHLSCTPPSRTLAAFWQTPGIGSVTLANLVLPVSTIVDVTLSLILNDDENSAITYPVSTGVLGQNYYLSLDNGTGHDIPPVSLTTTF